MQAGQQRAVTDTEQLYAERLARYTTAMRNGTPDRIPIRPFAAEFTARYSGHTCAHVTHDYRLAFDAVLQCARDFDWDAIVPNMVYVWTGMTQAMGLRYYAIPGIDVASDVGFQYREPAEQQAFMRREEYDELIADPTRFLYSVWLPRVSTEVSSPDAWRGNIALVKSAMAMLSYFGAFGPQIDRLRKECGTVSAISGILKAPLDILADKLRGYVGLAFDLMEIPDKVLEACRALMPHLGHIAITGLDPGKQLPIPIWMHRTCVPFISHEHFDQIYWPTTKPIFDAIWARGNQLLLYAEGDWTAHLERFAELPAGSAIFHLDRTDVAKAQRVLGARLCLSGGISNSLLATGTPQEVHACCKRVIDIAGAGGGYIMDASAILQNDASVENIRAMTNFTREYGVYGRTAPAPDPEPPNGQQTFQHAVSQAAVPPGVCIPWQEKLAGIPALSGDPALFRQVWDEVEGFAYLYIWQSLVG